MKDTRLNWSLNVAARVFVGLVFVFSGFVKGVDPLGTSYKITEYLTAWTIGGLSFEWAIVPFHNISSTAIMAMMLIVAEFTVGILLLTGSFRKLTAWILALMMLFFTATTLYDAITNEVTDCGCFGDAVKLTNWQTFWKNIVLDIPTVWIVLTRGLRQRNRFERDIIITAAAAAAMFFFGFYNINHEPCIDFRPWKVGNQMIDNDPSLQIQTFVTYRNVKTGETEEMLSSELVKRMEDPAWEEQWEWESSRVIDPHEINAPGFSMLDNEMNDHAQELIGSEDSILIVTIHHLELVTPEAAQTIVDMSEWAVENNVRVVLLTASLGEEVEQFIYDHVLNIDEYYFADATAIETIMRSNPGFMLMQGGKVLAKWHHKHLPQEALMFN